MIKVSVRVPLLLLYISIHTCTHHVDFLGNVRCNSLFFNFLVLCMKLLPPPLQIYTFCRQHGTFKAHVSTYYSFHHVGPGTLCKVTPRCHFSLCKYSLICIYISIKYYALTIIIIIDLIKYMDHINRSTCIEKVLFSI